MIALSLFSALSVAHAAPLEPTMTPVETVTYTTDDGWIGEIRHYPGSGPPVLLVHGMGANHYNYDFREEVSLAAELQDRGWDVWVPDLRGDPGTVAPNVGDEGRFDFDHHAEYDLPAIVDTVLAQTGENELYWVGHSMGGMLLYTAMSTYPDKIAAGVAICSPSTFEHPQMTHRMLKHVGWALRGEGLLPRGKFMTAAASLGKASPMLRRVANPEHLDAPMARGLVNHALVDVPRPMALQASTWVKAESLTKRDGTPWLGDSDVPLLVMGAPRDRVAPVEDVKSACDRFENCSYRELSVEGGFANDYGHADPLLGNRARDEVYPVIADWLEDQAG